MNSFVNSNYSLVLHTFTTLR